ncbi:hypothetical protein LPJ73_001078 [Coemansia sp. RSA 2703]|nr:hypothetical protein LPJ73_001078 [Coemansia sp. RSA 2703]
MYRSVSSFEVAGIRPPSKESVTVGETDLKFVHLRNGDDAGLLQYVKNGGIAFPHIMIPEDIHVRQASQVNSSIFRDGIQDSEAAYLKQAGKQHGREVGSSSLDKAVTSSNKPMLLTAAESAQWIWSYKESFLEAIGRAQSQGLQTLGRWILSPVTNVLPSFIPESIAAVRANILNARDAESPRTMLAASEGPISYIAWHPHRSLVAIAHRTTDTVFLYDMANDTWCSNILQNAYMQGITSMAWQPNSGYTLAVGCTSGVCLWSIIPSANATPSQSNPLSAPSLGAMQFSSWMTLMASPPLDTQFKYPSQLSSAEKIVFVASSASVSALSFSPSGQWLITGHQTSGRLTVWDVALGTSTPLKRSGGTSRLATLQIGVSPNGRHLVSTHANGQLRLWETEGWTSRVWSNFSANVSHFTWSPDSRSLFFSVSGRSEIYSLALFKPAPSLDAEITTISTFDAHATAAADCGEDTERIRVGGAIKSLALDPKGRRLVVGFDDDSASSDISLLAVYLVSNEALFRAGGDSTALMPLGFIRGPNWGKQCPNDSDISPSANHSRRQERTLKKKRVRLGLPVPSWFGFAPNFEPGALLTVAWANGKVAFYPMLFK